MWSRSRRLGLETHQRLVSVSAKITFPAKTLFSTKWAKWVVAIYGSVDPNRLCVIIIIIIIIIIIGSIDAEG